jgi:hypothetical protein
MIKNKNLIVSEFGYGGLGVRTMVIRTCLVSGGWIYCRAVCWK